MCVDLGNQFDTGNWTEVLTSSFFGASDPRSGRILDGRWKDLQVPALNDSFYRDHGVSQDETFFPEEEKAWLKVSDAHIASPYGLLRSPWNFNPSPYLARYMSVSMLPSISAMPRSIRQYYSGVTCDDYSDFITYFAVNKSLASYLLSAEDQIHGIIHFTFGGAGGDYADAQDQLLTDKYNFTDEYRVVVTQSAQTFFKKFIVTNPEAYETNFGVPFPLNCSSNPWSDGILSTTAYPGEEGGPSCTCNSNYLVDDDSMQILIEAYFSMFLDPKQGQNAVVQYIEGLALEDKRAVMTILCGRMQFDGEMAGSGAAQDPLFWVAHGAVERLLQKVVFAGVLTDTDYDAPDERCSGHKEESGKYWLTGFNFLNKSLVSESLSNVDLTAILNPSSELYRDNVNFVYDTSSFSWCEDADSWFP